MARLGSSVAVLDFGSFGSSMSIRGFTRLGSGLSVVGTTRVASQLGWKTGNTYLVEDTTAGLMVYVKGTRAATFESDGGILHGSWTNSAGISTSDRRLKKDIQPLQRTLLGAIGFKEQHAAGTQADGNGKVTLGGKPPPGATAKDGGALWLLRQLRPVSYSFRKGAESKYMRFGFIADELESVVPQVVRTVGDREVTDQKAVVYQDLIALLTTAMQEQQRELRDQLSEMREQRREMEALKMSYDSMVGEVDILKKAKQAARKKKRKKRKLNIQRRPKGRTDSDMGNVVLT